MDATGEERLMGRIHTTGMVLCAWLATVACSASSDETQGITASITFDPPAHIGEVQCTVTLSDANGAPVDATKVKLEGNMNHAGMVPVFRDAERQSEGVFVAPMEFTMGGDWLIFTRGTTSDGHAFEVVSEVPGVRAQPASNGTAEEPAK